MILESPSGGSVEDLADSLDAQLSGLSDAERFGFDQALKVIGGGAQTALPGVAQGAASGAALGPWGALIGGLAGGASSLASAGAKPRAAAPQPTPVRTPVQVQPPQVAAPVPATPVVATPSSDNHAAAQLLSVIQNPNTLQALASLVAGPLGKQQVPAGDATAPPASFLNLLTTLATQALTEAEAVIADSADSYLRGDDGEYAYDVANPEARASALLTHLQRGSAQRSRSSSSSAGDWLLQSGLVEIIDSSTI
jgi:hypothetical protein